MYRSKGIKMSIAIGLLAVSVSAMAAPSGAIFTTDRTAGFVNGNVYGHPGELYLNGGPPANAPCTAAGLPDDDYYFQVTDPSGQEVLSSDPVTARRVTVSGGVITANLGTHAVGAGQCNSVTVQLCPFNPAANEGDEYKVWMTSVWAYEAKGGLSRNESKTDNFKVTGTAGCVSD
jgi:hypothetical protein